MHKIRWNKRRIWYKIRQRNWYIFIFLCFKNFKTDGTTAGDGTEIGKCPSHYSTYKCLSTGSCNVCGLISGTHEGCDVTSTTPVCDADSTTSGIQDSASGKVGQCTACKKDGKWKKGDFWASYFPPSTSILWNYLYLAWT